MGWYAFRGMGIFFCERGCVFHNRIFWDGVGDKVCTAVFVFIRVLMYCIMVVYC